MIIVVAVMVAMMRKQRRRRRSLFICCPADHHSDHENYHFEEGFGNDEDKKGNHGDKDKIVDNDDDTDEGIVRVD